MIEHQNIIDATTARVAKAPAILRGLRASLLALIPADRFDGRGEWVHAQELLRFEATPYNGRTDKAELELLRHAQELLAPLADHERCRRMRPRWTNPDWSPSAPYGGYYFVFQVEMVLELVRLYPEFVEGFSYGRSPIPRHDRDANPYAEPARSRAWDRGYILGLTEPGKLREWLRAKAEAGRAKA